MTGPPTPPLTSPTEIEDAARSSVPPQTAPVSSDIHPTVPQLAVVSSQPVAAATPPAERRVSYEVLFPTLADLAVKGELQELIRVAENGDLSAEKNSHPTRLLLIAPLVLAYLTIDELPAARHVLTRLPDVLASQQLPQALFPLLSSAWERKYEAVYARAEDLYNQCLKFEFPGANVSQVLAGMVTVFVEAFRRKTFVLITKAYTSIPLSLAQEYLGLTADQVFSAAEANGWAFDTSTQVLIPKVASASRSNGAAFVPSTLATFNVVADGVARLET